PARRAPVVSPLGDPGKDERARPVLPVGPEVPARPGGGGPECLRRPRRARRLSWASLAWLGIEGSVSVAAGLVAGSVALVGFGIDSAIEALASVIVIWRFTGARALSTRAESRA